MIRPLLPSVTVSELHAIIAGGLATVAGASMGVYVELGVIDRNVTPFNFETSAACIVGQGPYFLSHSGHTPTVHTAYRLNASCLICFTFGLRRND